MMVIFIMALVLCIFGIILLYIYKILSNNILNIKKYKFQTAIHTIRSELLNQKMKKIQSKLSFNEEKLKKIELVNMLKSELIFQKLEKVLSSNELNLKKNKFQNKIYIIHSEMLNRRIKKIQTDNEKIKEFLSFQQSFNIELENSRNIKYQLKIEEMNLKNDYSFLVFINNIKIDILFLINLFRKIINTLIVEIITQNKTLLRKTKSKFDDQLKPKSNQNKFFIIHCVDSIKGVSKYMINVIFDFLMYVHNYTSSKIHFNNLKNLPESMKSIKNENSDKQTIDFYQTYDLVDYALSMNNFKVDIKFMINHANNQIKSEENEKQISEGKEEENKTKDKTQKDEKVKLYDKKEEEILKIVEQNIEKESKINDKIKEIKVNKERTKTKDEEIKKIRK